MNTRPADNRTNRAYGDALKLYETKRLDAAEEAFEEVLRTMSSIGREPMRARPYGERTEVIRPELYLTLLRFHRNDCEAARYIAVAKTQIAGIPTDKRMFEDEQTECRERTNAVAARGTPAPPRFAASQNLQTLDSATVSTGADRSTAASTWKWSGVANPKPAE